MAIWFSALFRLNTEESLILHFSFCPEMIVNVQLSSVSRRANYCRSSRAGRRTLARRRAAFPLIARFLHPTSNKRAGRDHRVWGDNNPRRALHRYPLNFSSRSPARAAEVVSRLVTNRVLPPEYRYSNKKSYIMLIESWEPRSLIRVEYRYSNENRCIMVIES